MDGNASSEETVDEDSKPQVSILQKTVDEDSKPQVSKIQETLKKDTKPQVSIISETLKEDSKSQVSIIKFKQLNEDISIHHSYQRNGTDYGFLHKIFSKLFKNSSPNIAVVLFIIVSMLLSSSDTVSDIALAYFLFTKLVLEF